MVAASALPLWAATGPKPVSRRGFSPLSEGPKSIRQAAGGALPSQHGQRTCRQRDRCHHPHRGDGCGGREAGPDPSAVPGSARRRGPKRAARPGRARHRGGSSAARSGRTDEIPRAAGQQDSGGMSTAGNQHQDPAARHKP